MEAISMNGFETRMEDPSHVGSGNGWGGGTVAITRDDHLVGCVIVPVIVPDTSALDREIRKLGVRRVIDQRRKRLGVLDRGECSNDEEKEKRRVEIHQVEAEILMLNRRLPQ